MENSNLRWIRSERVRGGASRPPPGSKEHWKLIFPKTDTQRFLDIRNPILRFIRSEKGGGRVMWLVPTSGSKKPRKLIFAENAYTEVSQCQELEPEVHSIRGVLQRGQVTSTYFRGKNQSRNRSIYIHGEYKSICCVSTLALSAIDLSIE